MRAQIDPAAVDDVVFGCVDAIGPQAGDIARTAWLAAGLPEEVPGVTIDRQCGSSQQAVHFAAQAVMSGTADLVVAGGMQNMIAIPIGAATRAGKDLGFPHPFTGAGLASSATATQPVSQFRSAEMIAEKWNLSRAEMEALRARSHRRAVAAIDGGRFAREIVPLDDVARRRGPRRDTSLEKMATLQAAGRRRPGHRGGASQISDGAAAMLVDVASAR